MLFTHKASNLLSLETPKGESIFVKKYSGLNNWKLEIFSDKIDFSHSCIFSLICVFTHSLKSIYWIT